MEVSFGADSHAAQLHQMYFSLPAPGEYEMEVSSSAAGGAGRGEGGLQG